MTDALEVSPASDWCQRWNDGHHSWRHRSEGGFDRDRYTVEAINEDTAEEFVIAHHYSRSYPAAKLRWGLFEQDALLGVLVLSMPMSNKVLTNPFPELEPSVESAELGRLVLVDSAPSNAETFFIARCFEEAAAAGIRGVVSFADPVPRLVGGELLFPGHIGTIYQASNAVMTGRSWPQTMTILRDGTTLNKRAKQKVRKQERGHAHVERKLVAHGARPMRAGEKPAVWLAEAIAAIGGTSLRHRGSYRYCFAIGTRSQRRRVRIHGAPLPYPKERDA